MGSSGTYHGIEMMNEGQNGVLGRHCPHLLLLPQHGQSPFPDPFTELFSSFLPTVGHYHERDHN